MKPYATPAVITLLIALCWACSPSPTLEDRVHTFLDAHNTYRVDVLLSLTTGDVYLGIPRMAPVAGRETFADWVRWDSVTATQWELISLAPINDSTVQGRLTQTSTWLQLLGVGMIEYENARFTVRDTLVSSIILTQMTGESRERLDRRLAAFEAWAQHEYPQRLERIRTGGLFDPRPRRAADWIAMLREWRTGLR